jgi:glycosyltransferase involved in cell wall biosynthesis
MSKSNILYVESNVDGTIGGSYYSLFFLVSTIDKSKYNTSVVFYRKNPMIKNFTEIGCKVILFKKGETININRWLKNKIYNPIFSRILWIPLKFLQMISNLFIDAILPTFKCYYIIKSENIDIVHMNNTLQKPQEWIFAAIITKTKLVAHERGINTRISKISKLLAGSFDAVICISKAVIKNLENNCGLKKNLHLVYNALDPTQFQPNRNIHEIKKEIGLKREDFVVGVIGNVKAWKGQDVALRAIAIVKQKYTNVKCLIIGGSAKSADEYSLKINSIVQKNQLEKNVLFLDFRLDVKNYVNALDILLHTSVLPEPFGRVLLEGMALEKPVVTVSIGAGPEIVVHQETGLVIEPGNEHALANAIIFLYENRSISKKMGIAGRQRLEQNFKVDDNTKKTEEIYQKILNKK